MAGVDTETIAAVRGEQDPRTRIRLCGPLQLEIDGREVAGLPGGQAGSLLGFLLAARDRTARRDELIAAVWPAQAPNDPHAALRPLLSRLRRTLAPATLGGRERLRLVLPEPVWLDVEEAAGLIHHARAAAKGSLWARVREQADAALVLLRPGFLPAETADWVEPHRRELAELELEALEWVARSGLALGGAELRAAQRASRELIERAPYRETGYRFLMEALAAGGDVAEALQVYERLRVLLRDELGTAPAPEVQVLHQRLLAGEAPADPAPREPPARAPDHVPLPRALAPRGPSEFVGRDRELGALRDAWAQAGAGGRRLAMVAGEPGIGKTRLTSELAREAHGDGTVLYAGCQQEALLPYQPFVETLRAYAQTTGLDWARVDLGAGAGELGRLIPELAAALPEAAATHGDPETRRYLLFDAVSLLLAAASADAPLLLVLDDLQWADRATLHLVRHVLRAPHDGSLLLVGTYRDAEVSAEHPLAELLADLRRDRLFERISLAGLDEGGVGALIASHAGHAASSGLVGAVHEQTEGNPFFVEEVLRHLIETGAVVERGGRWIAARTVDEIGVPPGVKDVLVSRLGRLSSTCRSALSDAAVLGREFAFEVLATMAESGDEDLIGALEEAVDAQLVVEVQGRAEPAYAFTHALVRETLYAKLSGPRRQRAHARAARAIEQQHGEEPVAALALHHRLAGSTGDAAKAVDYSLRAGARAVELSSWEEAAGHWDGALDVMGRIGGREADSARLLVALADLMVVAGDLARQIAYLEQALGLWQQLGDEEHAAQTHSRLGMAYSLIDSIYADHLDVGRAFDHFNAARRVLDQGPPRKARGHLDTGVSTALTYAIRMPEGIEAATRGMDIAEQVGDELLWAGAAQAYAWHTIVSGSLSDGLTTLERTFEVVDRHESPFLAFMGSNIRGQLTWGLAAPDEARAFLERPLHLAYVGKTAYQEQIADGVGRCHFLRGEIEQARRLISEAKPTWITHSLGPLLDLADGRWDEVLSLMDRVLHTSRRNGNRWDEWAAQHLAAGVRSMRGDLDGAGELLERALAIVTDGGARYFEMWVRPDLARVRAAAGRVGEAREHVDRCREILAAGEDWRGRAGHVLLAEALVLDIEARAGEAQASFDAAVAAFARYRSRWDEADALHHWGRSLAREGVAAEAREKLERSLEIYERAGAGPAWVQRTRAELAALRRAAT